jgi:hypothetical protein
MMFGGRWGGGPVRRTTRGRMLDELRNAPYLWATMRPASATTIRWYYYYATRPTGRGQIRLRS